MASKKSPSSKPPALVPTLDIVKEEPLYPNNQLYVKEEPESSHPENQEANTTPQISEAPQCISLHNGEVENKHFVYPAQQEFIDLDKEFLNDDLSLFECDEYSDSYVDGALCEEEIKNLSQNAMSPNNDHQEVYVIDDISMSGSESGQHPEQSKCSNDQSMECTYENSMISKELDMKNSTAKDEGDLDIFSPEVSMTLGDEALVQKEPIIQKKIIPNK